MNCTRALLVSGLIATSSWTCSDGTEPPTPTSVSLSASEVTFDALGATEQLTAQILDQRGQPMPEEPLTWSSANAGVATVSPAGLVTAVANGTVEVTASSGTRKASATVTVEQILTQLQSVSGNGQTGKVGQALPQPLEVEGLDRLGHPVYGVRIEFAVVKGSGSVDPTGIRTDNLGRARTSWTLGTTSGSDHQVDATHENVASPVSFTAVATTDVGTTIVKVSGDGQTGPSGTALTDSIVVRLLDDFDNLVPGQIVQFQPVGQSGAPSPSEVLTDEEGRAASEWTLGGLLGEQSLRVGTNNTYTLTFSATAVLGPPTVITGVSGDGQSATVGTTVPVAPTVRVTDAGGNPVAGTQVTFTADGGGSVTGGDAVTDADGLATVGSWTLGTITGVQSLTARIPYGSQYQFTATATAGPPISLLKEVGDDQTTIAGLNVTYPPSVHLVDQYGNGVPDVTVNFSVTAGGGSVTDANPTTDRGGIAAVGSWTLGPSPGTNELTAAVSGVSPVTFTATGTGGAVSIQKVAGDGQTATVGTAVPEPPAVRLTDALGNPVSGQEVQFLPEGESGTVEGAVGTSDANGVAAAVSWTLGTVAGPQILTAMTYPLAPVTFNATATPGPPAQVVVEEGDGQTGLVGFAVNIPPAARVTDTYANGIDGVAVTFSVASGGGSVTDANATTNASGIAAVGSWTLGTTPRTNVLDASVPSVGSAAFTANGVASSFDIEVRFLSSVGASQQQAFLDAAARWEQLLFGDLSDVTVNIAAGRCGSNSPAVVETIDDLIIFATVKAIDGPGGVLGQAGPCFIRSSNNLPLLGLMQFDEADLAALDAAGLLDEVIVHEMGHVLGFGALWDFFDLLVDPASQGGSDPHFIGTRAIQAFDRIGGSNYMSQKVPVENTGNTGTIDAHWRESVLSNELMTGFLNSGANPLSQLSVASFWDMGYLVNLDGAEDFFLAAPLAARAGTVTLRLGDDLARVPIYVVDAGGHIIGVTRRR